MYSNSPNISVTFAGAQGAGGSVADGPTSSHKPARVSDRFRSAVMAGLEGGSVFDVKFWAYSKRRIGGDGQGASPYLPQAVYANATCLLGVAKEHFSNMFESRGEFKENWMVDISAGGFPHDMQEIGTEEGYIEYDSDLEDEVADNEDAELSPASHKMSITQPPMPSAGVRPATHATPCARSGDNDIRTSPASPSRCSTEAPAARQGYLLSVPHVAHKTLRAFVYYSIFGDVNFAPLRSQSMFAGSPPSERGETAEQRINDVPSCSPKSMYRLADMWNIPGLQKLAMDAIESRLTPENIIDELFCPFTPLYPEVEATEIEYFMDHIVDVDGVIAATQRINFSITRTSSQVASNLMTRLMRKLLDTGRCPRCSQLPSPFCIACNKYCESC